MLRALSHSMLIEVAGTQQSASTMPSIPESAFSGIQRRPLASPAMHKTTAVESTLGSLNSRGEDLGPDWEDDIPDSDLTAAELSTMKRPGHGEKVQKPAARTQFDSIEQPQRLSNGNWKCRHRCKDRAKCGHMCCTQGLESKPKPRSKPKVSEKNKASTSQTKLVLGGLDMAQRVKRPLEQVDLSRLNTTSVPAKRIRGISDAREEQGQGKNTSAQQTSQVEQMEDEFDGFDDIDFNLATLPEPRFKPQAKGSSTQPTRTLNAGMPPNINRAPDAASVLSEEELLDAALVGAEDSLMLDRLACGGTMTDDIEDVPMSVGPLSVEPGEVCREDLNHEPVQDEPVTQELAELQAFMREQFGDLVELVGF